jgi:hypothetical protein
MQGAEWNIVSISSPGEADGYWHAVSSRCFGGFASGGLNVNNNNVEANENNGLGLARKFSIAIFLLPLSLRKWEAGFIQEALIHPPTILPISFKMPSRAM